MAEESIWGAKSRITFLGNSPLQSKSTTGATVQAHVITPVKGLIDTVEIMNARVPKAANVDAVNALKEANQIVGQVIRSSQTLNPVSSRSDVGASNNNSSFNI